MNKICFIVQEYYPSDPRIRKFAEFLFKNNFKVHVISLKKSTLAFRQKIDKNYIIYRTGLPKRRAGLLRYSMEYLCFFLWAFVLLNVLHIKHRFDVIHVGTLPDFLVFSTFMQKITGSRIILDMHEITPEFFQIKYGFKENSVPIKFLKLVERASIYFADEVITVSDSIKVKILGRMKKNKNITVVLNVPDQTKCRDFKGDYNNRFNLVYHGSLTTLYSVDLIVKALPTLLKEIPHLKVHIFGEGPEEAALKKAVDEENLTGSVYFHGYSNRKYYEILEDMDIGVLPMRINEFTDLSFSNKLSEFVSMKIPVVHSDINSLKLYFPEDSIYYFDGSVDDLVVKLLSIFQDPQKVQKTAEKAFDFYKRIDWNVMSKKYNTIIDALNSGV